MIDETHAVWTIFGMGAVTLAAAAAQHRGGDGAVRDVARRGLTRAVSAGAHHNEGAEWACTA